MQAGRASAHAQHNPLPHGAPTEPRLRQGGYRGPAASSISSVLLRSRGRLPRGVYLGGLPALVHSFFGEFLAIPSEVCPIPARPARGVHKKTSHSTSFRVLHVFYKPSTLRPGMPGAAVLRARNSSKNGERRSLGTAKKNIFTTGRNLSKPVNF